MNLVMAQASSGPSGSYLAAQTLTGVNYVSPASGCYIRRIMSSVRTASGQVFIYYADDPSGSNAHVVYHHADNQAYTQRDICDLWIPIPVGKYILTYGVGTVHDTSFSLVEHVYEPKEITATAYNITGYAALKSCNMAFQGLGKIKRVLFMNTIANSQGYLYWADDVTGSNANVLRGYAACPIYTLLDSSEDCITIPKNKYLLAHSEVGSFSCAVTVELPNG